jgi:hypothetical protein
MNSSLQDVMKTLDNIKWLCDCPNPTIETMTDIKKLADKSMNELFEIKLKLDREFEEEKHRGVW